MELDKGGKKQGLRERKIALARNVILDAANRLLMTSSPPEFSMRALSDEAGVSFTTPFNYFGNKTGIIHGLAARIFEDIEARYKSFPEGADTIERVLNMGAAGIQVWLEHPDSNRYICASLMAPEGGQSSPKFLQYSCNLWRSALLSGDGLIPSRYEKVRETLPVSLATAFRGVMALWIGGEIGNEQFGSLVNVNVATLLLDCAPTKTRAGLLDVLSTNAPALIPTEVTQDDAASP